MKPVSVVLLVINKKPCTYFFIACVLIIKRMCLFFSGVEQKRADYDNLVVTDGLELQKVLEQSARGNVPTTATTLSDEEGKDLQSAPATGLEDSSSDTGEDGSRKDIVEDSADSGGQVLEDKKNSNDVESKELSKNERRLTPVNDRGSKNRHDIIRTNRNYELKERLNIDSEGNKDQRHATRDSVAKIGENKLVRTAEEGKTAEFESSNAGTPFVPDSNLSASTPPPPYILKVKNTPARAELDDIYFLCKFFSMSYLTEIKV